MGAAVVEIVNGWGENNIWGNGGKGVFWREGVEMVNREEKTREIMLGRVCLVERVWK